MKKLSIDLESFSSADLRKTGVYRYVQAPDFEILLFGYSVDDGEMHVIDLAQGELIPDDIRSALTDETVTKWGFNSNFERICLSRHIGLPTGEYLDPTQWRCSMVWSAYLGLPLSLAGVGAVLKLDKQKLDAGKDLIKYFCQPCKPTKVNGGRTRNVPADAPDKWALFKSYNLRDVETEMAIQEKLSHFPVPNFVWDEYHHDQEINDRGIRLDMTLVRNAIAMDTRSRDELTNAMQELTELDNPNSVAQMKTWLADNGLETDSLGKKQVTELLESAPKPLADVLLLRQQLAKSSVRKYQAMENCVCADGRARGMFMFYGANRTGRFSGRLIQLQNLPRNYMNDLKEARGVIRSGDYDTARMLYDSVPDVLSELIRTTFVPYEGGKFIVADFSAIEARVIAWLAGEQWRLDVFENGGDIYCASASQMFHVPVEKNGANGHLRQKGKIAELALGYGGSVGALKAMGALEMDLSVEELKPLVDAWRESNPNIVQLWWEVDRAVKTCVMQRIPTQTHGIRFTYESGFLFITLPSGRRLAYVMPRIGENRFGGEAVTYEGVGATKKWERIESYGPKFVENCVAEDTLVVTDYGLVSIQNVTKQHHIWDGVEFVQHDGLISQGAQSTIDVNGIQMTDKHKILTTKGWMECGKAAGFEWENVSLPDCFISRRECEERKTAVAVPLCLRKNKDDFCQRSNKKTISCKILWVYEITTDFIRKFCSRHEPSPSIRGVALHEAALQRCQSPCLSQLWATWHNGVRHMGSQLRKFLEGYGAYIQNRIRFGPHRQQQGLQSGQLPVDNAKNQQSKSPDQPENQHTVWRDDDWCACGINRDRCDNALLPGSPQLANRITVRDTGCSKPVYDIRNCGPRQRFVVWNNGKGRIVSNCVQAISRDILCYAMQTLRCCNIVAHVHDEIIVEANPRMSLEAVCEQMSRTPPWVPGLELWADGFVTDFYKKD